MSHTSGVLGTAQVPTGASFHSPRGRMNLKPPHNLHLRPDEFPHLEGPRDFFYPTTCQPSNHSCKASKVNSVKGAAETISSLSKTVVSVPQCCNLINHLPGIQTRHPPAPAPGALLCPHLLCLSFEEGTRRLLQAKPEQKSRGTTSFPQGHF